MANLDTPSKRASSVGIALPFMLALVLPDGTIDQGDRQHTAFSYSGIAAGAPPVPVVAAIEVVYWRGEAEPTVAWSGLASPTVLFRGESDPTQALTGDA